MNPRDQFQQNYDASSPLRPNEPKKKEKKTSLILLVVFAILFLLSLASMIVCFHFSRAQGEEVSNALSLGIVFTLLGTLISFILTMVFWAIILVKTIAGKKQNMSGSIPSQTRNIAQTLFQEKDIILCPKCQTPNPKSSVFCIQCGTRLTTDEIASLVYELKPLPFFSYLSSYFYAYSKSMIQLLLMEVFFAGVCVVFYFFNKGMEEDRYIFTLFFLIFMALALLSRILSFFTRFHQQKKALSIKAQVYPDRIEEEIVTKKKGKEFTQSQHLYFSNLLKGREKNGTYTLVFRSFNHQNKQQTNAMLACQLSPSHPFALLLKDKIRRWKAKD